jgi:hypothetical protein
MLGAAAIYAASGYCCFRPLALRPEGLAMNLAHLPHADQVAAILTASEAAIRSAVGSLNSARRQSIGRKGGRLWETHHLDMKL